MTKEERNKVRESVEAVLPEGWKVSRIKGGSLIVDCPVDARFGGDDKAYMDIIRKIEKAAGVKYDGGGATVGCDVYNNYFYRKEEKND